MHTPSKAHNNNTFEDSVLFDHYVYFFDQKWVNI